MEFSFQVNDLLQNEFTRLEGKDLLTHDIYSSDKPNERLVEIINQLGEASAKAQGLRVPISTAEKFVNSEHVLYLLKEANSVIGFLKTGCKRLFLYDEAGNQQDTTPVCVLDFYIHESSQRQGFGLKLFQHMLEDEGVKPCCLAIDRPSAKFISFLGKHYNLTRTIPQVNNFTIFSGFFQNTTLNMPIKSASCPRMAVSTNTSLDQYSTSCPRLVQSSRTFSDRICSKRLSYPYATLPESSFGSVTSCQPSEAQSCRTPISSTQNSAQFSDQRRHTKLW